MSHLEGEHPDVLAYLRSGGFSVQIGAMNTFGRIPVDQTCEETINKDTQTPGGTKGLSLKPGAVSKYYLVTEYRSIFLRQFKEMLHLGTPTTFQHTDLQASRIARDEEDVKSLMSMLEESWINPFKGERQDLVCLSTGKLATPEIEKDLLQAEALASSETQGQPVGTTRFSWAKVYNKSGRAPGHLLLPIQFQKRLNSLLLTGQKNIFLANQRRGTAGRLSCLLTRGCFPHQSP